MPDLHTLLSSVAETVVPTPPSHSDVERRFRRRRARCTTSSLGVVLVLTGGVVAAVASSGGHPKNIPAASGPCVVRTAQNAHDTFVAIPASGVRQVDVQVWSEITVGWQSCGETGDFRVSGDDPKLGLIGAPGSGFRVPTTNVSSARFQLFHSGTVTLTGQGSLGSSGTLEITIGQVTEPVGASEPSPYPGRPEQDGVPSLCLTPVAANAQGRITQTVGFNTATLAPAPEATSRFTAAEILDRYSNASWAVGAQGHPRAYFGAMTDNNTNPFPKDRPLWVVVVCDAPYFAGSGGAMAGPAPAPGTSPSPGGQLIGLISVPFDENGHALGESITDYADKALLAEKLFETPFERKQPDAMEGRQVALTYTSDDSCVTFDHLEVSEPVDGSVYVQVWLRLLPGHDSCPGTSDSHDVVVGLRAALADRLLVRGMPPR